MRKEDFLKLKNWANSIGVKVDCKYFYNIDYIGLDSAGYANGHIYLKIRKHKNRNNYVNWTEAILDLAHELGHHLDDIKVKNPNYKAHSYQASVKGEYKYIPHWARKVILRHELNADLAIPDILETVGISITKQKIDAYIFENQYVYEYLVSNYGMLPTRRHMRSIRRKFKRLYNAER